jgi:competence ComEA-like helix-hairpin-helix protein
MPTAPARNPEDRFNNMRNRGSILVGLLWCVVLLALIVVGVLHTATMDLKVTKNYGDKIQAHYLALAGIEKSRALLHQAVHNHAQLGRNRSADLFNSPDQFRDVRLGRGEFRVFRRGALAEGGGLIFGISDEESRLNANAATAEELTKLNGLSPDIASAILAWRGQGDANPNGANADYYASLQPPYQPRNAPFQTMRELLMVRGVTPDLLFGNDSHQNGFLPAGDDEQDNSGPAFADGGWAAVLTVHSADANVNVSGKDRVNIQTADENALTGVTGITSPMARAIVQYRNQNRFQSIADLLDVTPPQNQNGPGRNSGAAATGQANQSANSGGPRVIDQSLLMEIADDLTASSDKEQSGLLNLNTASLDALICLPGIEREQAQAIVSYAQSQGGFANVAELLKVSSVDRQLFKQIAPLVTTRSETFRILSEGRVKSTGTRQRIEMIVRVTQSDVAVLAYREDSL